MTDQNLQQLRADAEHRREAIARDVELVTDRVAPGRIADRQKAKVRRSFSSVRSSVFGTSDHARRPQGTAGHDDASLRDRAGSAVERISDSTPDSIEEFTEGNPLAAGLIGVGVGLLAATLIPTTDEEQRLADRAQDTIDSAATQVAKAGQHAADAVKPAVEDAAEEVKASAQDSVQAVKGDTRDAAQDVRDHARSRAQEAGTSD